MKRHPALVPLSEEHHQELAHARRLLRAAGAVPEERLAVASAYLDAFFTETVEHFRREEEILFPLYVRHAGSTPVLERILREHMELHGLVRALRAEAAAGDIPPEALRTSAISCTTTCAWRSASCSRRSSASCRRRNSRE